MMLQIEQPCHTFDFNFNRRKFSQRSTLCCTPSTLVIRPFLAVELWHKHTKRQPVDLYKSILGVAWGQRPLRRQTLVTRRFRTRPSAMQRLAFVDDFTGLESGIEDKHARSCALPRFFSTAKNVCLTSSGSQIRIPKVHLSIFASAITQVLLHVLRS